MDTSERHSPPALTHQPASEFESCTEQDCWSFNFRSHHVEALFATLCTFLFD